MPSIEKSGGASAKASGGGPASLSFRVQEQAYRPLLEVAQRLIDDGYYGPAVVTSQTSLETFMGQAFTALYVKNGLNYASAVLDDLLPSTSPHRDKTRDLYESLSRDGSLTSQPFWPSFQDHVRVRNRVVHRGDAATKAEAAASLKAVSDLIAHVTGVLGPMPVESPTTPSV